MKVLLISTDQKVFDPNSAVSKRIAKCRKLFEQLDVVVLDGTFLRVFRAYKEVKKITENSKLKIENYVVSTQDPFETGLIGVFLKLFYGVPLQIQLHTDFNNKYFLLSSPLNFIRFFIAHLTLPFADSVRAVSKRVAESIRELNKNMTILPIYTEVQTANRKPQVDSEKITVLTIARLEKEKDIGTAIKAFAKIAKNNPNTEFVIVGDGSQRKNLELVTSNLKLETRVKFVGWQNDLGQFYATADIYFSTSLFEGYGMSIIEAGSAGIPLVISDAGIAGEVFRNGESALICKPKDVSCFASMLEKLLENENLRMRMGKVALSAVLAHKMSSEEYLAAYKKGIESAAAGFQKSNFAGRCMKFLKSVFKGNKVLRFILAGGTATLSQIVALYIFTDIIGVWYLYSSILSFAIALFISFTLQKFWAFRDKVMQNAHVQFVKYTVVIFIGLLLNTAMMFLLVDILHLWYILAQIITGALIAVFNFISYKKFIFNK